MKFTKLCQLVKTSENLDDLEKKLRGLGYSEAEIEINNDEQEEYSKEITKYCINAVKQKTPKHYCQGIYNNKIENITIYAELTEKYIIVNEVIRLSPKVRFLNRWGIYYNDLDKKRTFSTIIDKKLVGKLRNYCDSIRSIKSLMLNLKTQEAREKLLNYIEKLNSAITYQDIIAKSMQILEALHIPNKNKVFATSWKEKSLLEIGDKDISYKMLCLLRSAFAFGDIQHIEPYITDNCLYQSEWGGHNLVGKSAILENIIDIGKTCLENNIFYHFYIVALIENGNSDDLHPIGTRGIVFSKAEKPQAICFIDINENKLIDKIEISIDERYVFDEVKEPFEVRENNIFVALDNQKEFNILQKDYVTDDYGVGYVKDCGGLYLINREAKTAIRLPQKYQKTPIYLYHFCGGYSNGLIMVSLLGEIDLQYHHNYSNCAGIWGWIDVSFNEVINPQYVYAENFINEKSIVCKGEWKITEKDNQKQYWCEDEKWGVINTVGEEVVPCIYDELYRIEDSNDIYFFAHKNGWENGNYCIFDVKENTEILQLNFDFDIGYMFNSCALIEHRLLFMKHVPGEGIDYIYLYNLITKEYEIYEEKYTERTYNGKKKVIINKDGKDIIVF